MTKTLLYLFLLLLLATGIYFFIFREGGNPFGNKEAGFNIKDTAAIGKIFIVANDGESILIERKTGYWELNGKYKALPSITDLVLKTLATQNVLYPVPKAAYENSIQTLSANGVKVEVYDRQMKKISVFYVGGSAPNGTGTHMLQEGAKQPYVVQAPAFTGDLRPRYSTHLSDWRDRTVFNIPSSQIRSVSIQYADLPLNSFTIIKNSEDSFAVQGAPEVTGNLGALNTTRVSYFLNYFTNINCEGYMNGLIDIDSSIRTAHRMSVIDVQKIDGTHQVVDIFWMPINKRSKNQIASDKDVADIYDADRMYALINNRKDTVMIQMQAFKKLFRNSYEFYEHSDAPGAKR